MSRRMLPVPLPAHPRSWIASIPIAAPFHIEPCLAAVRFSFSLVGFSDDVLCSANE